MATPASMVERAVEAFGAKAQVGAPFIPLSARYGPLVLFLRVFCSITAVKNLGTVCAMPSSAVLCTYGTSSFMVGGVSLATSSATAAS